MTSEARPGTLVFPSPTSASGLCGRGAEWSTLVGACRRAAASGVVAAEDSSWKESSDATANVAVNAAAAAAAAERTGENAGLGAEEAVGGDGDGDDCDDAGAEKVDDAKASRPIGSSELVVLRGMAGTGKSFLVERLKHCVREGKCSDESFSPLEVGSASGSADEVPNGYFAQGRFNRGAGSGGGGGGGGQPYAAITTAFNDLVEDLTRSVGTTKLRAVLNEALDDDAEALVAVVPHLRSVIGSDFEATATRRRSMVASDSSSGLRFLFRKFAKALSGLCQESKGALVLALDDAECVDDSSLSLISALANDSESRHLVLVLSVREEEYGKDHPLRETLKEIRASPGGAAMTVTEITLEDLDEDSTNALISSMLRQDPDLTAPLTDLVRRKTLGNPLFSVQFVRSLVDENFLEYDINRLKWKWDSGAILTKTDVSENVVDLVVRKIESFPEDVRFVLLLASCLNFVVDTNVLTTVCTRVCQSSRSLTEEEVGKAYPSVDEDAVERAVDLAVHEGLMEHASARLIGTRVKFAHDRVRQAALESLMPPNGAGRRLHLEVGKILREIKEADDKTPLWMLFSAVDHLNTGSESMKNEESRIDLAQLNLEAGEQAIVVSAFLPASQYLRAGVDLIDEGRRWDDNHYELNLLLMSELASTLYCCGKLDDSKEVSEEVVANARSLREKFRCYLNLIALLKAKGELNMAVEIGVNFLAELGEKFELKPSKLKLKLETLKTQKLVKKYTDDQLMDLPPCEDDYKSTAIYVLGMLFGPMVHLQYKNALDILRMRGIRLTIENGVCEPSALACAYYGSHLISQKVPNISEGYRFGKLALALLDKLDASELKARTILLSNFLIVHWKEPLHKTLDRLMNGYSIGMLNGDIEMAFTNAGIYQQHYYYCGLPLGAGAEDIGNFCRQMEEYKQTKELRTYQPLWQCLLNLMGKSETATKMTGEAMDQDEFEKGKLGVAVMRSYRMQLAYYFGDVDLAEELMDELRPQSKGFAAPFFQVARRFFFALIVLARAKETTGSARKKYLKTAKEDSEWLRIRVDQGAINCLHKLLLIQAELSYFGKDEEKTKGNYDKAISTARRSGFSQDEALGNELAAGFFLSRSDTYWASYYFQRAYDLYTEWGAHGKAEALRGEHTTLLAVEDPSQTRQRLSGTSFMGRRRFSHRLSEGHKSVGSGADGVDQQASGSSRRLSKARQSFGSAVSADDDGRESGGRSSRRGSRRRSRQSFSSFKSIEEGKQEGGSRRSSRGSIGSLASLDSVNEEEEGGGGRKFSFAGVSIGSGSGNPRQRRRSSQSYGSDSDDNC